MSSHVSEFRSTVCEHCLSIFCAFVTVSAFFQQYGQCRAINNVALAEVKEVCVSGGSMEEKGK